MTHTRRVTNKILEAADEGLLTWEQIASAALMYMSEDQVADMAHVNEFLADEDEDEGWSPFTAYPPLILGSIDNY